MTPEIGSRLGCVSRTLRLPDDLTNRPYYRNFGFCHLFDVMSRVFVKFKQGVCLSLVKGVFMMTFFVGINCCKIFLHNTFNLMHNFI